jgi:hypothetical protein
MKLYFHVLLIALILVLFACHSAEDRQKSNAEKSEIFGNSPVTSRKINVAETKQKQSKDCVRGQAEPVIQKKDYPNTTFILQADSLTAIETITFENGDQLIIRHWGCEYYVLTFRFETSKFQQDTANLEYWFKAANRLMTSVLSGIVAPIDIKLGLSFVDTYILGEEMNKFPSLKLGDQIEFEGGELRSSITLDSIEKLTDKKFAVTISFTTGPL